MHAAKLLRHHFGSGPELFFDSLSGISQPRRGRATLEQPFDAQTRPRLWARLAEEKSCRHKLESIHYPCLGSIVGRHFDLYSISDGQTNESLAHLARDMREYQMIVCQRYAKHGSGQDGSDCPLQLDRFFRIHHRRGCKQRSAQLSAGCPQ